MINWSQIIEQINSTTGANEQYHSHFSVSGGDISSAYQLVTQSNHYYFVKLNDLSLMDMFIAEFKALNELQKCTYLSIPQPICYGQLNNHSYLVMEYLSMQSHGDDYSFGQGLAKMHKISQNQFGWKYNNTIGSTPQSNQLCNHWPEFWKYHRLIPQLELLYQKGYSKKLKIKADELLAGVDDFFEDHYPIASLLHGDLWSGNVAFDNSLNDGFNNKGHGVIFDPALYYGDRETDLAMTELFGGFSKFFYQGYQEEFAIADSYSRRKPMYNLYHILNHANLFGGSYIQQSINMIEFIINEYYK